MKVQRVMCVNRPLPAVVGYLGDFAHAPDWDPGTLRCDRVDDGPIRVGSTWRNVSVFAGRTVELDYRLDRLEPHRLTFTGRNRRARTVDDLTFAPDGDRTWIIYRAEITLRGPSRLATPFLRSRVDHLADEVAVSIPAVLQALGPDTPAPHAGP